MTAHDLTKRISIRWLALSVAAIVTIGGFWISQNARTGREAQAGGHSISAALRRVEVIMPERHTMARALEVPATIEPFEQADLYANTTGYVAEVRVDIGDRIRQGDVLAIIDVPEMADELRHAQAVHRVKESRLAQMRARVETVRAELQRFEAESTLKKITFERKQQLRSGNAIPEQELDQAKGELDVATAQVNVGKARVAGAEADVLAAEAEVSMAQAAVARLQTLMEYATIRAPFDGIVSRRLVDRGVLVQPGNTNAAAAMFTVQRIDLLRIYIDVPEVDVPHVPVGANARVMPYGMSDLSFNGSVTRIASSLNPGTRTMRCEIDLANSDVALMPGMYAIVSLELDRREHVLTIPAAALLTDANKTFVYTVREGRAARTYIRTGQDDGIRVEVTKGLDDGAQVIVAGKGLVSDGSAVQPVLKNQPSDV